MNCPKCSGQMSEGFALGFTTELIWIEGAPEAGMFGVKIGDNKCWKIQGYRCEACGYLELYANKRSY